MRCLAVVLIGAALAAGCGGEESATAPTTAPTQEATTTEAEATTTAPTTTAAAEPERTVIEIAVRDGKARVTKGSLRVRKGDRVTLRVKADVEDEVHLHGYDLATRTAPGHPAKITFVADQRGAFIIELEEQHLHLGRLRVGQ